MTEVLTKKKKKGEGDLGTEIPRHKGDRYRKKYHVKTKADWSDAVQTKKDQGLPRTPGSWENQRRIFP